VARKPELVVIAGPNGSGKTTITRRVIRHAWGKDCLYLNPDEIAEAEFGGWDSPEASLQAARKAEQIREECLISAKSLMFETVFSAPDKVEYIKKALGAGFFVRLFFICTDDPSINEYRVARRRGEGGHGVPHDKILSRYSKSIAQCAIAIKLVDRAYLYDNSVDDADPVLLFRTENGALKKVYRQPVNDWAKSILEKLC
jgi:predicted ABC-type ATPase